MLSIPRQPSNASLLSSSRSHQSSLLPCSAASTAASSAPPASARPPPLTRAPAPASDDPLKHSSIHLPLALPGPGPDRILEDVDLRTLRLEGEFADGPVGFVVAKLRRVGPALLRAATATSLHIPAGPELPQALPCSFPILRGEGVAGLEGLLLPSHLLAIHAPDSARTLLLPVHGLVYASLSPALARLAATQPAPVTSTGIPTGSLPVVHLNLPSAAAVPLLQGWVYLRSRKALLAGLLPRPPAPDPPAHGASRSLSGLLNPTAATLTQQLSRLPAGLLLQHVELLHGLWGVVCALGMADAELWGVMRFAWAVVVGALVLNERRRAEAQAPA